MIIIFYQIRAERQCFFGETRRMTRKGILLHQLPVLPGPAVPEEAPGFQSLSALFGVNVGKDDGLFAPGKLRDHLAPGARAEAPAVETEPVFPAYSIDPEDEHIVGKGIGGDGVLPEAVGLLRRCCGSENDLGAFERSEER